MKKNHKLPLSMVLSGGVLLIIILATLLATLSPYDPIAVETGQKFLPPSAQHLLGTDNFGRDTFTRLLYGGRVSLLVGFLSMLISIVFGTVYGIVSGSSGKLVDGFMMRIVDILMSVPSFLIIITLNIYMNAGIRTLVVTIGLFSWMGVARIVRAEVLSLRERDFILASEGLGARKSWVITRHFARNVFSPVLVASTNSIASAILTESSLSYLGFGISIPNPEAGPAVPADSAVGVRVHGRAERRDALKRTDGLRAGVNELREERAAGIAHALGKGSKLRDEGILVQRGRLADVPILMVDRDCVDDDVAGAALCAAHKDIRELLGHRAVGRLIVHAHRRHGDTVFQRRSAQLQGREDFRIFHIGYHVIAS